MDWRMKGIKGILIRMFNIVNCKAFLVLSMDDEREGERPRNVVKQPNMIEKLDAPAT